MSEENLALVDILLAELEYLKKGRVDEATYYEVLFLTNTMSALWEQSAHSTSVVNIMAGSKATNGNGPLGMRDKSKITQENRLMQYL